MSFLGGSRGGNRPTEEGSDMSRVKIEDILRLLEDGIVIYDRNFKILFLNPAAENIFKVKAGEVLGKTVGPQDAERPEMRLLVQVVFPSLAPVMIPRSSAGSWPQVVDLSFSEPALEIRTTTSPFSPGGQGGSSFLKVVRDRTREVMLLKTKSDFVTVASHQLKTPLTEVSWALQALDDDKSLSGADREIVKSALMASQLLVKIVEDLLNISRIEEGHFGYKFDKVDLVKFLNEILGQALPQASRAGVRIYLDAPQAPLPAAVIDVQKLSVVVTNLVDNAIRYNVKNGEAIIKIEQVPGQPFLRVSVKDTGIGVPQESLQKLFGKFFRAENAVKFQTEGTGLGLYIAKNIVEAHGGKMWAESEVNRGSTFYFTVATDESLVPKSELPVE